jgi:hypothetical protein
MSTVDPDNLPRHTRVEMAAYVIAHFRALNVEPPPRVLEMHRVLSRGYVPFDDPDFWTALEALRDLHQLGFIFEQLRGHRGDPNFRRDVRHLRSDPVLPQDDLCHSQGRDYQFQLFLTAICQRGGMLPVRYEEPDVLCTVNGATFAIAAKRLKSDNPARFGDRVFEAIGQIRDRNVPGIVAVDLSFARNRTNQPMISPLHSQMHGMIADAQNRRLFEVNERDIRRWVEGTQVLAVLVFDFRIRLRPEPNQHWGMDGTMCWFPSPDGGQQAARDLSAFQTGFLRCVPNLVNLEAEG